MSQLNVNTGNTTVFTMSSSTDLASLLECPVCFDHVLPPIQQCQNGHLVCTNCKPKLSRCPTCRDPLGNIRNLAMEQVASNVKFPCKYSTSGCPVSLVLTEKADHEDTCKFHLCSCPYPGSSCKWQGSLEEVVLHLTMSHKTNTPFQGEYVNFLANDIDRPVVNWVQSYMIQSFGYHFMFLLEKQEQQFFAIVKLVGSKKQAETFAYRLELNGHRRRLTWEATPRSIHEGVSSDCLVFHTSTAQVYAYNGNLRINVTISKTYPEKSQKKRKIEGHVTSQTYRVVPGTVGTVTTVIRLSNGNARYVQGTVRVMSPNRC